MKNSGLTYQGWKISQSGTEWVANKYDKESDTHFRIEGKNLSEIKTTIEIFMKESCSSQKKAA